MSLSKARQFDRQFKNFQAGQNMGRKGPGLSWDPLANPEDSGGSDAPDMSNGDVLSPLRVPVGMNARAFLETQTNGCCGD